MADHLAVLPVVAWTAADREWIEGSPAARRRLIDQGIVGRRPGALAVRSRYRQALEHKRRLLATGGEGLGSWNEVLAAAAAELMRMRRSWVEALATELAGLLEECDLALPPVHLEYRPSPALADAEPQSVLAALESRRRTELERRMPVVGPHRDDLEIGWGGHNARRVASAGEGKLLGLTITAARARLLTAAGRPPLVMLDDLDAELDDERLRGVWSLFEGFEQLFATSSRDGVREILGVSERWRLEGGRLRSDRDSRGPGTMPLSP